METVPLFLAALSLGKGGHDDLIDTKYLHQGWILCPGVIRASPPGNYLHHQGLFHSIFRNIQYMEREQHLDLLGFPDLSPQ